MRFHLIDLHIDLAAYVGTPGRTIWDSKFEANMTALQAVMSTQILPLFAETGPCSWTLASAQAAALSAALRDAPGGAIDLWGAHSESLERHSHQLHYIPAIENASCLLTESDSLSLLEPRLDELTGKLGKPLYVGVAWAVENRFGGGEKTNIGLKPDGEALLEVLSERRIAVDLSHSSVALMEDVFSFIERRRLPLEVLASHSLFSDVFGHRRNLPRFAVAEIIRRRGLIGLPVIASFVGDACDVNGFCNHVARAFELFGEGLADVLALGSDFYYLADYPELVALYERLNRTPYLEGIKSPLDLPGLCDTLGTHTGLEGLNAKLGFKNAQNFITRCYSA